MARMAAVVPPVVWGSLIKDSNVKKGSVAISQQTVVTMFEYCVCFARPIDE